MIFPDGIHTIRESCRMVVKKKSFDNCILALIIVSSVMMAATPNDLDPRSTEFDVLWGFDLGFASKPFKFNGG
jgi:hypothetical protein